MKCFYCKVDEKNKDMLIKHKITEKTSRTFHIDCLQKYLITKNKCNLCKKNIGLDNYKVIINKEKTCYVHIECEKEFIEKEKKKNDWDNLYSFFKKEILEYPDEFNLSSSQVLALKNLTQKDMLKRGHKQEYDSYSYDDIYQTLKYYKNDIVYALRFKEFKNENSKTLYCIAIIKNKINDYLLKSNENKRFTEKTNSIKIEVSEKEYTKKNKINKKLLNLISNQW